MQYTDEQLKSIAFKLRLKAVEMVYHAKTGHCAPSMSIAEILSVLYFHELRLDPSQPKWKDRDRFILSKGHACPIYYAALAERGFFPKEDLLEYRALNSKLQGHPDMRKCPGVDMTTGSLGNGIAAGLGMALIGKKDKKNYRIFVVTGDGELQEGIVWESVLYAGNAHLDNLIAIVDANGLQSGGYVSDIQDLSELSEKFSAFGWNVQQVDGHSVEELKTAIEKTKETIGSPSVIIAKTIKGKGISYMENQYQWHMKAPNDEQYAIAVNELEKEVLKFE